MKKKKKKTANQRRELRQKILGYLLEEKILLSTKNLAKLCKETQKETKEEIKELIEMRFIFKIKNKQEEEYYGATEWLSV